VALFQCLKANVDGQRGVTVMSSLACADILMANTSHSAEARLALRETLSKGVNNELVCAMTSPHEDTGRALYVNNGGNGGFRHGRHRAGATMERALGRLRGLDLLPGSEVRLQKSQGQVERTFHQMSGFHSSKHFTRLPAE